MTSSNIPSRIAFKTPFAITGDKTAIADSDSANVNMQTGFPSVYSVPAANGGKYVARGDMNALLNLSTNDLFYHKCGGLNTFDAEFAVKVGGYPKGAILKYIDGTDIYDVISLVDDNKIDFTGTMPTSSQQTGGILPGSVDGVHWAYCNVQHPTRERLEVLSLESLPVGFNLVATGDAGTPAARAWPVRMFIATKNGALVANLDSTVEEKLEHTEDYHNTTVQSIDAVYGVGIIAKELGSASDYDDLTFPTLEEIKDGDDGWKLITADSFGGQVNFTSEFIGCANRVMNISPVYTTAGKYYVIAMLAGSVATGSSTSSDNVFLGSINASLTTTVNSLKVYID